MPKTLFYLFIKTSKLSKVNLYFNIDLFAKVNDLPDPHNEALAGFRSTFEIKRLKKAGPVS